MLTRTIAYLLVLLVVVQSACKWEQIRPLAAVGKMKTCGRTPENQAIYFQHIDNLKNSGVTLPEYIKDTKFGFYGKAVKPIYLLDLIEENEEPLPVYLLANSPADHPWARDKVGAFGLGRLQEGSSFVMLTPNDFPYDFEEGIEHWILWATELMDLQRVDSILEQVVNPQYETITYVNEPKDKSIPQIFHAQMFIRRRPKEQL